MAKIQSAVSVGERVSLSVLQAVQAQTEPSCKFVTQFFINTVCVLLRCVVLENVLLKSVL